MNVAFDPWIPVVTAAGERTSASLRSVLADGKEFADLAVRPHERVALMRLFLCVAHAALKGPKNVDEWLEVPEALPGAVEKYLEAWKDSFDLFHTEKPWLQVAALKGTSRDAGDLSGASPVALLDFELATGHTATLHDHGGLLAFRPIPPERVALSLLTFQNFSPGGGSPVAQWNETKTLQVGNPDAPCLSQSMAHCLLRGRSLAETIHLNLPDFETVARTCGNSTAVGESSENGGVSLGRPVWEFFPQSPDKGTDRAVNATRTYLGRLVPISRWIRLIPGTDRMFCCKGFKYDTYKDGFAPEPSAAVQVVRKKDKKGAETTERRVVSVKPSRALWRELSSLLVKRSASGVGGPLAMSNAPSDSEFDFHVCAMIPVQASMDISVESVFHISPAFLANLATYHAEIAGGDRVLGAEGYARKLRRSIEEYRQAMDADWKPRVKRTQAKNQNALRNRLAQAAFLSYWTTVEKNLPLLMAHIEAIGTEASDPTLKAWRKMLSFAAHDGYRLACSQDTPRQMRAFAKGLQKLTYTRPEADEKNNRETKEEEE